MRQTVSFVDFWRVLDHIGFEDELRDWIYEYGFDGVTWGDAAYTLIGNNFALDCIQTAVVSYYHDWLNAEDGMGTPSRNLPEHIWSKEEIAEKFWQIVGQDDYINMEG